MSPWAAITTAPRAERLVSEELTERALPHLYFKRVVKEVYRGRLLTRCLPAFPSYIFVQPQDAWPIKREVKRVLRPVADAVGELWLTPDSQIQRFVNMCDSALILPEVQAPEPYKQGEKVEVVGYGPVSGHNAVYQHLIDNTTALLDFEWFGRTVPIAVDLRDIRTFQQPRKHRKYRRSRRSHNN